MVMENTYAHFMYRQLCVTPALPPSSVHLDGHTGIVVGSNIGLGFECCRQLLDCGLSHLILAVRSPEKGEAARSALASEHPNATLDVWEIDLCSYDSIKAFARRCDTLPRLDFVVLNAGVFKAKFEKNKSTGNEMSAQVNWLSNSLLTILLLPVMRKHANSRITIVSSETASWAKFKEQKASNILAALNDPKQFDFQDRYYASKLLQVFFFREICERVDDKVTINAVNPGFCWGSGLHRDAQGVFGSVLGGVKRVIGRSISVGARTLTDAVATQPASSHGKYLGDNRPKPFASITETKKGQAIQKKLWDELVQELSKTAPVEEILKGCSEP